MASLLIVFFIMCGVFQVASLSLAINLVLFIMGHAGYSTLLVLLHGMSS